MEGVSGDCRVIWWPEWAEGGGFGLTTFGEHPQSFQPIVLPEKPQLIVSSVVELGRFSLKHFLSLELFTTKDLINSYVNLSMAALHSFLMTK